ncbi:MAG: hypothetical protein GXP63_01560 [DPANN group archaeon]|nr:hypothetical protein [DPANN group archaeon]
MATSYEHKPTKSKYLTEMSRPVKYDTPLKRSMSGYEIEMCLIDGRGDVSQEAGKVIERILKQDKDFSITKEAGQNMLEVMVLPHKSIQRTALQLIENVEKVQQVCEDTGLAVLPLGTYPGTFKERIFLSEQRYKMIGKTVGRERFDFYSSHCYGFHYHYALPKGTYNEKEGFVNNNIYSKIKTTLIDSYNFMIAADPMMTTLAQSSPFEGGRYRAKDTRMLYWRGGKKLKAEGFGQHIQMLAGLQPYKQTMADLLSSIRKKDAKFKKMLRDSGAPESFIRKKHILDYMWNPVKVNKIGTLEQRGMDTNYLEINLGITIMLKFILRAIQQEFYHVIPSDFALEEPFKLEGNVIFIPPHTHVRNVWQYQSAYQGFQGAEIAKAIPRFYKLARKLVYKSYLPALRSIKSMIDRKQSLSDKMISYVKKKGYTLDRPIPKELSRSLSLLHAKKMVREMERTKKIFENLD